MRVIWGRGEGSRVHRDAELNGRRDVDRSDERRRPDGRVVRSAGHRVIALRSRRSVDRRRRVTKEVARRRSGRRARNGRGNGLGRTGQQRFDNVFYVLLDDGETPRLHLGAHLGHDTIALASNG